jgi:hypothetical protein
MSAMELMMESGGGAYLPQMVDGQAAVDFLVSPSTLTTPSSSRISPRQNGGSRRSMNCPRGTGGSFCWVAATSSVYSNGFVDKPAVPEN